MIQIMKANYKKIHKLCYQENVLINNLPEYDISDGFLVSFDKFSLFQSPWTWHFGDMGMVFRFRLMYEFSVLSFLKTLLVS
ncbi:hypothetical protein RIR_jg10055.t2 [Rhizophagus irregularis DAOM 181602=DAOM 197198]|nr:hypothetical protein RIR_jg10055.t2 [Rhizophagus irregularis DAOM 181602=DAOM 197198]